MLPSAVASVVAELSPIDRLVKPAVRMSVRTLAMVFPAGIENVARLLLPVSALSQKSYVLLPRASRTELVFSWFSPQLTQAEPLKCRSDWPAGLLPVFQLAMAALLLLLRRSTYLVLPEASGVFCVAVAVNTRENQFAAFSKVRARRLALAVGVADAVVLAPVLDGAVWLLIATSVATEPGVRPVSALATSALARASRAASLAAGVLAA